MNMKVKHALKLIGLFSMVVLTLGRNVLAQSSQTVDDIEGLKPITLPFFLNASFINAATPLTYLTLFLNIVYVAIAIMWVFYIIRSAVQIIQSQGDDKIIQEAYKKIRNVLTGAATLFLFFALLSLVGAFFGIGNFFEWPKSFSRCTNGEYYFEVALTYTSAVTDTRGADIICFGQ
jgi:predicted cation transporter